MMNGSEFGKMNEVMKKIYQINSNLFMFSKQHILPVTA